MAIRKIRVEIVGDASKLSDTEVEQMRKSLNEALEENAALTERRRMIAEELRRRDG